MELHEARRFARALIANGQVAGKDAEALRALCESAEDGTGTATLMAKVLAAQAETITALGDQVVQLSRNPTA